MQFDGVDDYVNVGDKDSLDAGTSDFSIATWVKFAVYEPDGYRDNIVFKQNVTPPRHGYILSIRGSLDETNYNRPYFMLGLGTSSSVPMTGTSTINDGIWHHLLVSVNRNGYMKLYRDGIFESQVDISAYSAQNEDTNIPLTIGGISDTGFTING
ncbi:MAG: LamG-like jellyroll fold domain-containing protein, partial [Nanoarchaeota archaeon]